MKLDCSSCCTFASSFVRQHLAVPNSLSAVSHRCKRLEIQKKGRMKSNCCSSHSHAALCRFDAVFFLPLSDLDARQVQLSGNSNSADDLAQFNHSQTWQQQQRSATSMLDRLKHPEIQKCRRYECCEQINSTTDRFPAATPLETHMGWTLPHSAT